jgi:hypothetical protein
MILYQYEVTLVYAHHTEVFDVDADGHTIEVPGGNTVPPFIVFHRDVPIVLDPLVPAHAPDTVNPASCICGWEVDGFTAPELAPDKLAGHIAAGNETSQPLTLFADPSGALVPVAATCQLEVFRAPLHALLAVKLLDEEEEEDEPEVHP